MKSWTGRQERQNFTYPITRNTSYTFSWVFQKMDWDEALTVLASSRLYDRDMVRIYSINVTNTIDGGAASCLPCPKVSLGGCLLNPRQSLHGVSDGVG